MRATGRLTRALAPVLVAALAVGMAACGSSAGTGAQAAHPSSTLDALSTDQLAAQAAKEGSVTWYTTFADDDVQPMVAAFNKIYPNVKVNALRLSADQIPARIITEQRGHQYSADVVSGDSPQIAQLLQAGVLQPYTPKDLPPLPSGLSMPTGYEGIVYLVTTVIAYNPTVVKQKNLPVPTSWEDLTKPAWKGQFSIDPGAVNWYDSLIKGMGHDQALALLKASATTSLSSCRVTRRPSPMWRPVNRRPPRPRTDTSQRKRSRRTRTTSRSSTRTRCRRR